MPSRFNGRQIFTNAEDQYKEYMDERGVKFIRHYATPTIHYPTANELATLDVVYHIWSFGDRFYKLADKHYGDSTLWWIIPWFNQKPTEAHFSLGDVVNVPLPLSSILRIIRF